jgi:hypothetical protein
LLIDPPISPPNAGCRIHAGHSAVLKTHEIVSLVPISRPPLIVRTPTGSRIVDTRTVEPQTGQHSHHGSVDEHLIDNVIAAIRLP